jgi:D-glycero-D-manno-heptose 1,7-bisphosphate phosphatase
MVTTCHRAVFLDRDGVLSAAVVREGKPFPPQSLTDLEILPGVADALADLRNAGFLNIVVTNQPDVATGKQKLEVVTAMHDRLLNELPIDDIEVCYHTDAHGCECRKPRPGMLLSAAKSHEIDLSRSFLVGDRWRDVAAGQTAGCTCFFVDRGYRERRPDLPYIEVKSLSEAAGFILSTFSR